MLTRKVFIGIMGIGIVGAALWYIPASRDWVAAAIPMLQANLLYVMAATAILVFALAFMIARSTSKARNRKRDLDEYMRVAQQTASETQQSFKKEAVETKAEELSLSAEDEPPKPNEPLRLKAIQGGRAKQRKPPQREFSRIFDELYFQPVTHASEGQIVGYEIFRQAKQVSRQKPAFIQFIHAASKADQAEFEFSTLQKAASATEYEMWHDISLEGQISFFVYASDALLDDKTLWRRAAAVLRKRSKSNPSITLKVHSSAFANVAKTTINERLLKLKRLHDSGVSIALLGFEYDHELVKAEQLSIFNLSSSSKDEFLNCHAGEASPGSELAYQQVVSTSLEISVQGIVSETDVVDCLAAGAKFMSGDYLAPPRKLKSDANAEADAAE